jgi:hypothetical protein
MGGPYVLRHHLLGEESCPDPDPWQIFADGATKEGTCEATLSIQFGPGTRCRHRPD